MVFSEVPAEQETVVFQDVGQGQRQRLGSGRGAGHDPARARAGHQRADGQAQLVDQVGLDQLAEQVRAPFRQQAPVAASGEGAHGGLQVHGLVAGHEDVRVRFQPGTDVLRGLSGGDDDRAGVRGSGGDQGAVGVEVQPRADHRDRRGRRPAGPQGAPGLLYPGRLVALGPHSGRADHDDVSERAEQGKHLPVGVRGQVLGGAVKGRGPVGARHHVGAQPRAVRVGVQPGQIQISLRRDGWKQLLHGHSVDRRTTMARSRTSISLFGVRTAPTIPRAVSMTTSQPVA